jgi:hypothetical protein
VKFAQGSASSRMADWRDAAAIGEAEAGHRDQVLSVYHGDEMRAAPVTDPPPRDGVGRVPLSGLRRKSFGGLTSRLGVGGLVAR